jgi:hypothetical protein
MMKDIGLHLNPQKLRRLEKLDAADLEARQRLFLGAYLWDKSISICLGRPPTLTDMPQSINDICKSSVMSQHSRTNRRQLINMTISNHGTLSLLQTLISIRRLNATIQRHLKNFVVWEKYGDCPGL